MPLRTPWAPLLTWGLLFSILYLISRMNYPLFHSLADTFTIFIAFCIFVVLWNARKVVDNHYFLFVAIALFFFAFLDFLHLLGNRGMGVFPQYGNLGPPLYIASRYLLSLSFLIAPFFIHRPLRVAPVFTLYGLVTALVVLSIFSWRNFPVCYVEGVGLTPFKLVSDYVICLILIASLWLLRKFGRSFDARVLRLLFLSLILSVATGLAFTLYSDPFGIMNAVGHFFQILSFAVIYRALAETGLTRPQDILFAKLKASEQEYRELFDGAADAACLISTTGEVLAANLAACTQYGYSRSELLSINVAQLEPPGVAGETVKRIETAVRDHHVFFATRHRHKDGSLVDVGVILSVTTWRGQQAFMVVARNITPMKKAEAELRESEARYRSLFESSSDPAFVFNQESLRLVDVNAAAIKLYGYTREEMLQLSALDLTAEPDKTKPAILMQTQHTVLRYHRKKDGSCFPAEITAGYFSVNGLELGTAFIRDTSDRMQAEQEREALLRILQLINSEGDLKHLIREIIECLRSWIACEAVGIRLRDGEDYPYFCTSGFPPAFVEAENRLCTPDINGQLLRDELGNPVLECMCGNIIHGRFNPELPFFTRKGSFWSNCTSELLASTTEQDRQAKTRNRCNAEGYESVALIPLQVGKETLGLIQLNDKCRDRFTREMLAQLERIADSVALGIYNRRTLAMRDSIEVKLREVKECYDYATGVGRVGVWDWDILTGSLFWSDETYRLLGFQPAGVTPSYELHLSRVLPDDRPYLERCLKAALYEGKPYSLDCRFMGIDDREIICHVTGKVEFDPGGRPVRMLGTIQDITDQEKARKTQQELQVRLQRAEKMEALGLLAGGVAHDLNNVLGAFIGYAELLHDDLDKADPRRQDARHIIDGGERAAAIVQDLLTLARRGAQAKGAMRLDKIVIEYLQSTEGKKMASFHPHVRIRTELEEGLLLIHGSQIHLSKALMNLVANALEAMPSGGEVTIRTENIYLDRPVSGYDEVREGDYVLLTVSDEGLGIADEDLKHIFEPFYTKKVMGRSGTGLGLAVVWGAVKDHEGYIDVLSQKDKGTTFQLYFPVTLEREREQDMVIPLEAYLGHGERLLVVDDVEIQRNLAKRILEKLNYRVDTASSGEAALDHLQEYDVDLVVLDMIMEPGMDGFDTYRQMKEIRPGQRAIIVSGFAETERVLMTQSLGAGAFVKKPYIKEKIGLAVRHELNREMT